MSELIVVPSEQGPFHIMWAPLKNVEALFVPYAKATDAERAAFDGSISYEGNSYTEIISKLTWANQQGRTGAVFTDRRLVSDSWICVRAKTVDVLSRYFYTPKKIDTLAFNSSHQFNLAPPNLPTSVLGWSIPHFALGRLIGLVQSDEPISLSAKEHFEVGQKAMQSYQSHKAFHHVSLARELGHPVEDCIFSEASALDSLCLYKQAWDYLVWYKKKFAETNWSKVLEAQFSISLLGKVEEGIAIAQSLLQTEVHRQAALQIGRGHYQLKRPQKALEYFELVLEANPHELSALLGRGLCLRTIGFESKDRSLLAEALQCFELVSNYDSQLQTEALHHAGTVYASLNEIGKAREVFERTLTLRESAVTRRNLFLILQKQGAAAEALQQFNEIIELDPIEAKGLEQFLQNAPKKNTSPLAQREFFISESLKAFKQLKGWGIGVQGDILDFKRVDDYFAYHAPGGYFLDTCAFGGLSDGETVDVLRAFALHLAGVLVRRGHASWATEVDVNLIAVRMNDPAYGDALSLYSQVEGRLFAGANADNLTSLEFLSSLLPEYLNLHQRYASVIQWKLATESEVLEFRKRAEESLVWLRSKGFELAGAVSDLQILDNAIDALFPSQNTKHDAETELHIIGLGLYLGFIVHEMAGGQWYSHPSLSGVSLQELPIRSIFPVQKMKRRIAYGEKADAFSRLSSLTSGLVVAELARKVELKSIKTAEEIRSLLQEKLPTVMKDDPTGASLDRMVDMVQASAQVKLLGGRP